MPLSTDYSKYIQLIVIIILFTFIAIARCHFFDVLVEKVAFFLNKVAFCVHF